MSKGWPQVLETRRLRLRQPSADDASAIFHSYATNEEVTRYLSWPPHTNVTETHEFLAGLVQRIEDGTEMAWALDLVERGEIIGMISAADTSHGISLGYVLAQDQWGKGLMTEAASAVVAAAQTNPHVFRVWAYHDIDNHASGRVMEKAGLVREAVLKRWMVHPNVSEEPRDCVLYSWVRPA